MCAGAMNWVQLHKLVFGADDVQRGYHLVNSPVLHPRTEVISGIRKTECSELIKQFFRKVRES